MKPPIVVELTEVEAQGYKLAGNAGTKDEIETQISIILNTGGMNEATAEFMAGKLTKGALSARKKIEEATRFEIKVISIPKPSTLLKPVTRAKAKPKPKAKKKTDGG